MDALTVVGGQRRRKVLHALIMYGLGIVGDACRVWNMSGPARPFSGFPKKFNFQM